MRHELITHNGKTYTIVESVEIKDMAFVICLDAEHRFNYFKKKLVNGRYTYIDYSKLITILPEYEPISYKNCQNILEALIKLLNNEGKPLEVVIQKFNELITLEKVHFGAGTILELSPEYFEGRMKKLFSDVPKLSFADLLRVDDGKLLTTKDDKLKEIGGIDLIVNKPIEEPVSTPTSSRGYFARFAYMLLVVVAAVGFMECLNAYTAWKQEGKDANKIMDGILAETEIVEVDIEDLFNVADDSSTANLTAKSKYTKEHWAFANVPLMSVDFRKLKKQNTDTVGWIYVNNTYINYPFVQGKDNSDYLNRSFDQTRSAAGWLFADYRSDLDNFKRNTVIYGHGRVDQVMFGTLDNVLKKEWYTNKDNHIIKLSTPDENTLWQVVSIYTIKAEAYYLTHNFENDESYKKFLDTISKRSKYNFEVELDTKDKILTLSTCLNEKERIVLHAKLVKSQPR